MATVVEKLIAQIGLEVDPKAKAKVAAYEKFADTVIGAARRVAKYVAVSGVAMVGLAAKTAMATAKNYELARSLGVSLDAYEAYGDIATRAGLSSDTAAAALRTLNVQAGKLSSSKPPKALQNALAALGLSAKEFVGLNLEQQYEGILQASSRLGRSQEAMAATQVLLGRSGAILAGSIAAQGVNVSELVEVLKSYDYKTDESIEGSVRFASSLRVAGSILGSLWETVSGFLGGALAPLVAEMNAWLLANKELITSRIKAFAEGLGRAFTTLARALSPVLRNLDKIIPALKIMAYVVGGALLTKGILALKQLSLASSLAAGKIALIALAFAAIGLAIEDVYGFFHGKDSVTEDILRWAEKWIGIDLADPLKKAFGDGAVETLRQFWIELKTMAADWFDWIASKIAWVENKLGWVKYLIPILGAGLGARDIYRWGTGMEQSNTRTGAADLKQQRTSAAAAYNDNLGALLGVGREQQMSRASNSMASYYTSNAGMGVRSENMSMARGVNINAPITVNGAKDPRATAREIKRELEKHSENARRSADSGVDY